MPTHSPNFARREQNDVDVLQTNVVSNDPSGRHRKPGQSKLAGKSRPHGPEKKQCAAGAG